MPVVGLSRRRLQISPWAEFTGVATNCRASKMLSASATVLPAGLRKVAFTRSPALSPETFTANSLVPAGTQKKYSPVVPSRCSEVRGA